MLICLAMWQSQIPDPQLSYRVDAKTPIYQLELLQTWRQALQSVEDLINRVEVANAPAGPAELSFVDENEDYDGGLDMGQEDSLWKFSDNEDNTDLDTFLQEDGEMNDNSSNGWESEET